MEKKRFSKRKMWIGLLVGFFLIWAFNFSMNSRPSDAEESTKNLIASHNSSSPQYNKNCTSCHANILTETSLNPSIPNVHVAMLPHAPGEENNDKCIWCHSTVDLVQGTSRVENSEGNLRRGVDVTLCTLCHGPSTVRPSSPGKQFYQTGISPTQPDGPFLYNLICAACHGDLANSQVKGESASEIQKKINENEGGMGPLSVLTTGEIQAIANALAN